MRAQARRKQHKLSFEAFDDLGQKHTINMFVEIVPAATYQDPTATIEGLRSFQTSEGMHVNRLDKGKYQIVGGAILSSADPVAP